MVVMMLKANVPQPPSRATVGSNDVSAAIIPKQENEVLVEADDGCIRKLYKMQALDEWQI